MRKQSMQRSMKSVGKAGANICETDEFLARNLTLIAMKGFVSRGTTDVIRGVKQAGLARPRLTVLSLIVFHGVCQCLSVCLLMKQETRLYQR